MIDDTKIRDYIISPNLSDEDLTQEVAGVDQLGNRTDISVIEERPLTIFLNNQEIVTAMTIGDYPEYLALGFLRNQKMLSNKDKVDAIDFDSELNSIVIRTKRKTNYEDKLKKKTQTSWAFCLRSIANFFCDNNKRLVTCSKQSCNSSFSSNKS